MKKGLSLLEMLLVLSIIGIMAAVTVPMVNNFLPSMKLSSSAKAVSSKLRQAQEEAVTTQIRHGIKFNTGVNPPTIDFIKFGVSDPLETVTLGNGTTLAVSSAIANNTNGQNSVFFSSDGGPDVGHDVNGDITVTLDTAIKTINISTSGVIKIQ